MRFCRFRVCASLAFAGLTFAGLNSAHADVPTAQVGITKTKPANGPSVEVDGGFMVPYIEKIPGTDLTFEMIPIPGGTFMMGSPEDEEDRRDDEGPQFKVNVDPMWVAKTEVNWAQYDEYMKLYKIFKDFESQGVRSVTDDNKADAITAPTELYDSTFTWEYGHEPEQAAVTMTQYSAQQFSKWLSRVTGQQYRLPTEAEWEYAARGGTETPFYWGGDAEAAGDQAWFFDNSDEGQSAVGTLAANPFGLHDMLGNVFEWTVNQHTEDYREFKEREPVNAVDVVKWPEMGTECVVRGGSWESDVEDLRCAARLASDDEAWKEEDPNFPRSPWWFTSDPARGVGFRLFRSYENLSDDLMTKFWEANADDIIGDVESRIQGGRGGLGLVDPSLPEAINNMDE